MGRGAVARFVIAGEDRAHAEVVPFLTDRLLKERLELSASAFNALRSWSGLLDCPDFYPLKRAFKDARDRGLRVHGHFGGQPGEPEASMYRALFLLCLNEPERPRAVVVARDSDGKGERRRGFEQAVSAGSWSFETVLAFAEPEIEAWILCGFTPEGSDEAKLLSQVSSDIGFDPTTAPGRLTSKPSPRDAKQVSRRLGVDTERKEKCLTCSISVLKERGGACGLARFFADAERQLVPLLGEG